jgi:hypothetical protein
VLRRPIAIAAVLCLLALPAAAVAQNPFGPLPQSQQQQAPPTTTGSSNTLDDGGGLKTWQEILLFLGGVILLGGIGYGIVIDARRNAPVKEGEEGHIGQPAKSLPKARTKPVRRAQARRARAARKRNR